jgi:hypothetical protein
VAENILAGDFQLAAPDVEVQCELVTSKHHMSGDAVDVPLVSEIVAPPRPNEADGRRPETPIVLYDDHDLYIVETVYPFVSGENVYFTHVSAIQSHDEFVNGEVVPHRNTSQLRCTGAMFSH